MYDANGNLLSDGSTTYGYDAANRMISTTFGVTTTLMAYDGFGRLISETVSGATTEFIPDESRTLPVMLGEIGASEKLYAFGGDGFAAQQTVGGNTNWALLDGLGSVRHLTDGAGNTILSRTYDAWGVVKMMNTGAGVTRFGFTGELQNVASGLTYLRARHYLAGLGRFAQRDTFEGYTSQSVSLNRYIYGFSNPLKYTDPLGNDPLDQNWVEDFTIFHHCAPAHYDRMVRLFSIAFPDEWAAGGWDKFYSSDGQLRDDPIIRDVFKIAPSSRSWKSMPDALANLAGSYEICETAEFVRDIGSLFGGMADRFDEPSALAALQGANANHWVWLTEGGLPQDLATDIDGNVHHWAFGVLLGHTFGPVGGQIVNSIREYNQAAGGGGRGIGDIWTNGLDVDRAYSDRGTRADIGLGNRGAVFGTDVGNFGISPWRVRIAYWAMVH